MHDTYDREKCNHECDQSLEGSGEEGGGESRVAVVVGILKVKLVDCAAGRESGAKWEEDGDVIS